ncbi:hypothetical protein GGI12_006078, partial [Dipsacomyces acuminosporus]
TNSVAYMHDKIGLHRIGNPSTAAKAVSLHLYSPPYNMCKTFDQTTGAAVECSCAASRLTPPPPPAAPLLLPQPSQPSQPSVVPEASLTSVHTCAAASIETSAASEPQQSTAITSM